MILSPSPSITKRARNLLVTLRHAKQNDKRDILTYNNYLHEPIKEIKLRHSILRH